MSLFREINNQKSQSSQNEEQTVSDDLIQLVTFNIADEVFGMDILKVQEIIRMTEITRVPNSFEYVVGVINLRGKIIPIINLRRRLGMPRIDNTTDSRIIVVEHNDVVIGLVVDMVNQVTQVKESLAEPPPPMVGGVDSGFITSIYNLKDRIIIYLDLTAVIANVNVDDLEAAVN